MRNVLDRLLIWLLYTNCKIVRVLAVMMEVVGLVASVIGVAALAWSIYYGISNLLALW